MEERGWKLPLQVLNLANNKLTSSGVSCLLEALTKSSAGNLQKLIIDKADLEPRYNVAGKHQDFTHKEFCKALEALLRKNKNLK